ncbi:hypothetical protein JCM8097_009556 [Rhodosporidiobolus ruineniae]
MAPSRSRIPLPLATIDENAPPTHSAKPSLAGKHASAPARSRIPSSSSLLPLPISSLNGFTRPSPSSSGKPVASSTRFVRAHEQDEPTPAYGSLIGLGIAIQAPTSPVVSLEEDKEKRGFHDEEQMPTPPNSQSPSVEQNEVMKNKTTSSTSRISRSSSAQLAPPPSRTTRRSSRSPSLAQEAIPPGPSHAPHVLAARRRSSVSPLPPRPSTTLSPAVAQTSSAATPTLPNPVPPSVRRASLVPVPPTTTATATTTKSKGTKPKPKPRSSETLPAPLVLSSDDSDGEDPLLLLGPEQTRGKGEGKVWPASSRSMIGRSGTPLGGKKARGKKAAAVGEVKQEEAEEQDAPAAFAAAEPEQMAAAEQKQDDHPAEEEYGGGFDGNDTFFPDDAAVNGFSPAAGADGPVEQQQQQPFDDVEDDYDYGQTDSFAPLRDASSGSEADPDEVLEEAEKERSTTPEPAPPPIDAASSSLLRSYASRPSYPPVSPDVSGEYDSTVPVRMGSSPPGSPEAVRAAIELAEEEEEDAELDEVEQVEQVVTREVVQVEQIIQLQQEHLAAPAPPSTGFRSPSPAVLSPFFRRPNPSSTTPGAARPASARKPAAAPLVFASPRLPRERYPNLSLNLPAFDSPGGAAIARARPAAVSPAPTAAGREEHLVPSSAASSSKTWTRGPAFFRSSSFSPPPHADQPRSATLYARRPGHAAATEEDGDGEPEKSREYHHFQDLTPTSPHVESLRELREEVRHLRREVSVESAQRAAVEEEEEEEEEVVLVGEEQAALERARTATASPAKEEHAEAPPTPAKDYDVRMSSPSHSSVGGTPPPRSPGGDMLMSSPSPVFPGGRTASFFASSPARSTPGSPSEVKRLPPTPLAAGAHEADADADVDARMASPVSVRKLAFSSARPKRATPLPKPRRSLVAAAVETGRERLTGLLFGPAATQPGQVHEQDGAEQEEQEVEEDDDDDQLFPQPEPRAVPPADQADESTFSSHPYSNSSLSFASTSASTSRQHRRRRSRSRPSHPTLPVIEISSTDAKAAARAAAILKCYHDYIEQGVEAIEAGERSIAKERSMRREAGEEEDDEEEEEELRTLLLDAEDEVRQQLPRRRSESIAAGDTSGAFLPSQPAPPSSASSVATPAPAQHRPAPSTSTSNALTCAVDLSTWTSAEWRRLEQTLVEVGRRHRRDTSVVSSSVLGAVDESVSVSVAASAVGEEVEPERVVEAFLRKWGVAREECEGQWAWDTLLARVNALKARRAKDYRLKRSGSISSSFSTATSLYGKAPLPPSRPSKQPQARPETLEEELRRASSPAPEEEVEQEQADDSQEQQDDGERSPSPVISHVKAESVSGRGDVTDSGSDYSDDDEGASQSRQLEDDTFFNSRNDRRARRTSVQPVYLPTALSNPALRHLYGENSPPAKPSVPVRDYLREESPVEREHDGEGEEDRSREPNTPEQDDAALEAPSSAQRLFSYLGSFVRRSPAPEPSPSSVRVNPATSRSASPDEDDDTPEMREVKLHSSVVTPRFASTSKPFPPLPHANKPLPHLADRKILPLPPSHFPASQPLSPTPAGVQPTPIASSSRVTLDGPSTSSRTARPRRRSSGESGRVWEAVQAIEEAESSREEEEARIIELLQSGGAGGRAKRRAAFGDLRTQEEGPASAKGKGKGKARQDEEDESWRGFVEIDRELNRTMVHAGTRALDRRPSGELRATRR